MGKAHKDQILALKNSVIPIDEHTTFYADFDNDLNGINGRGDYISPMGYQNAFSFNGTDFYIDIDVKDTFPGFSVSFWMYYIRDVNVSYPRILARTVSNDIEIVTATRSVNFRWASSAEAIQSANNYLVENAWHHYTIYFNRQDVVFMRDAVIFDIKPFVHSDLSEIHYSRIGSHSSDAPGSRYFKGYLSDFRIWNKAISVGNVKNVMLGYDIEPENLLLHYKMDSLDSNIVIDSSYKGNDGQPFGEVTLVPGRTVATLRKIEGRFNGGVAVERATTNIVQEQYRTFELTYSHRGSEIVKTLNMPDPYGENHAARIQTSGGTHAIKMYMSIVAPSVLDRIYTNTIWVKNLSNNQFIVHTNVRGEPSGANQYTLSPNQDWIKLHLYSKGNGVSNLQFQFRTLADRVNDELDFLIFQPQIEENRFATSFTNNPRPAGVLRYPASILNPSEGTINLWIYIDPDGPHSAVESWSMAFSICEILSNPSREVNQISLRKHHESALWRFYLGGNVSTSTFVTVGSPTKGWHMFTLTWNQAEAKSYLNGQIVQTILNPTIPVTFERVRDNALYLGSWVSGNHMNSVIDDFRIDKIVRSSNEIMAWYQSQAPCYTGKEVGVAK